MNNYYEINAKKYIKDTIDCNMIDQYVFFMKHLLKEGTILDVGFGSGRDMKYFNSLGYRVIGIDITPSFVANMKKQGYEVYNVPVEEINYENMFEGIWACASLLHVKRENLKETLVNCINALKDNGILYCSFKYGTFEGVKNGRYFSYLNEELLQEIVKNSNIKILETSITFDVRKDKKDEKWMNVILKKIDN